MKAGLVLRFNAFTTIRACLKNTSLHLAIALKVRGGSIVVRVRLARCLYSSIRRKVNKKHFAFG